MLQLQVPHGTKQKGRVFLLYQSGETSSKKQIQNDSAYAVVTNPSLQVYRDEFISHPRHMGAFLHVPSLHILADRAAIIVWPHKYLNF